VFAVGRGYGGAAEEGEAAMNIRREIEEKGRISGVASWLVFWSFMIMYGLVVGVLIGEIVRSVK